MKKTKVCPVAQAATPETLRHRLELRRSNAATAISARKERRTGSRSSARRAAVQASD